MRRYVGFAIAAIAIAGAAQAQETNKFDAFMNGILDRLAEPRSAEEWLVYLDDDTWAAIKSTSVERHGEKREFIGHMNLRENPDFDTISRYSLDCSRRTIRALARIYVYGPDDREVVTEPEPEKPVATGSPIEAYFNYVCDKPFDSGSLIPRPIHRGDMMSAAKIYWKIAPLQKSGTAIALLAATADPVADAPSIKTLSQYLVEPRWQQLFRKTAGIDN